MKCKDSREMKDVKYKTAKNGTRMAQSVCPKCGTKITRFMKKDADAKKK